MNKTNVSVLTAIGYIFVCVFCSIHGFISCCQNQRSFFFFWGGEGGIFFLLGNVNFSVFLPCFKLERSSEKQTGVKEEMNSTPRMKKKHSRGSP